MAVAAISRLAALNTLLALTAFLPGAARAEADLFSPETFAGVADLRLGTANGEPSWLDGGFGKLALGDETKLRLSEASLQWKPRLSFALGAVVTAQVQPDADPALDLGEAYLTWRAPPSATGRVSARAGLFFPPVSLEHTGIAWTAPDVLTPSAAASWIGEEVKVAGLELKAARAFGGHELSATAAVFGGNDTAGTLLAFRGWALHPVKAGLDSEFGLPPLSPFMRPRQADRTDPVLELDGRPGYYGAVQWRPPAPMTLAAFYYDNAGDRVSVEDRQWAWETRFAAVSATYDLSESTTLSAQAMNGETLMGWRFQGTHRWIDMGYRTAYVAIAHRIGDDTVTGRLDAFETNDRTLQALDNNDETGWAAVAAWRHRLSRHADLLVEASHVSSDRPSRAHGGVAPRQDQTALQTALRLSF